MGIQHRLPAIAVFIALVLQAAPVTAQEAPTAQAQEIVLDGKSLTLQQVVQVAMQKAPVKIDPAAMERVSQSYDVLIAAAVKGIPIYGLNFGVGENKDKEVIGPLTSKNCDLSKQFNRNNLRATSAGAGPEAPEHLARAAMLIRLNTMLVGRTGAQPRVAELYRDFLNKQIHPVLPTQASVGEADIIILAHIGLAMMGEGDVIATAADGRTRKRMSAGEALQLAKITPLGPFAKDSLAIMSSNAYATAVAVLTSEAAGRLLLMSTEVISLSLEALNGNVSPFLPPVTGNPTRDWFARWIVDKLEGSFLWSLDENPALEKRRALQDPFSYRTVAHVLAAAYDANKLLAGLLRDQINSSDDNPAVIVGIHPDGGAPEQVKAYYVDPKALKPEDQTNPCEPHQKLHVAGAVIPTGNFDPLRWVVPLQATSIALSHVSRATAARITRLGAPEFSKLTRFLTNPDDEAMLGYSAIQKTYAGLDSEIQALSGPVSTNAVPHAGDIEDLVTNSLLAASRLQHIVDNLYQILAIEQLHAAQAIDVRAKLAEKAKRVPPPLGAVNRGAYEAFRRVVKFLDHDRVLTKDIAAAIAYLRARSQDSIYDD